MTMTHPPRTNGLDLATDRAPSVRPLRLRPAWTSLETHFQKLKGVHLRQLFAEEPRRGERLAVEAAGIYLDYSKNRITEQTLQLLIQLAQESRLQDRIDAMFRGERINVSENRAVLHVALRAPRDAVIMHDGRNVVPEVHTVLDRMADFADRIRTDSWTGHTGKRIRNVINIGIGGSDLGPVMAYEALRHYSDRARVFRFVSNVDGTDFAEAVVDLDPAETLFIVSSKTFTTLETMTNAQLAVGRPRRRGVSRCQTFRRFIDQCPGGGEVRHRRGQHVRVLGLGRWALFHGFSHWSFDHAGDRPR